jgi:hypothetical protein
VVGLHNDLEPDPEVLTAAFARTENRVRYAPDHPLNRLCEAMRAEAAARRSEEAPA